MYVIIDIDGTLADSTQRAALSGQAFWDPARVLKDTRIEGSLEAIKNFQRLNYELVFLTGRPEHLRDVTERWLQENYGIAVHRERLLMRSGGNMLTVREYKREQLNNALSGMDRARGVLCIDNDPEMWPMLAEFGAVLKAPQCWKALA